MTTQITAPRFSNPEETWSKRFSCDEYIFGTEANHFLIHCQDALHPGMRALVVADGEGRNSVWLAEQGLITTAFDISPIGVNKARKLAQQKNVDVNFVVADCDHFDWAPAYYDAVVAIFVQFADPEMRARLFSNMIHALKPGGVLILQGYSPAQLEYKTGGPQDIAHLYTEELLRDSFSSLDIRELRFYDEVLNEGTQHAGRSALVGMLAYKTE